MAPSTGLLDARRVATVPGRLPRRPDCRDEPLPGAKRAGAERGGPAFAESRYWPSARLRRPRAPRVSARASPLQILIGVVATVALWATVNWIYQVIRKPSELFFPVSGTLYKVPAQTWEQYESIFRRHSTSVISAEFLAALAQVEGSGNPIARTYWRWSWRREPFEVYRPASSAVGMYQITDGTFAEAQRYCIHDHAVAQVGPWYDWRSCWFNRFYIRGCRVMRSSSPPRLELERVENAGASTGSAALRPNKQNLAALIHLCGSAPEPLCAPWTPLTQRYAVRRSRCA